MLEGGLRRSACQWGKEMKHTISREGMLFRMPLAYLSNGLLRAQGTNGCAGIKMMGRKQNRQTPYIYPIETVPSKQFFMSESICCTHLSWIWTNFSWRLIWIRESPYLFYDLNTSSHYYLVNTRRDLAVLFFDAEHAGLNSLCNVVSTWGLARKYFIYLSIYFLGLTSNTGEYTAVSLV